MSATRDQVADALARSYDGQPLTGLRDEHAALHRDAADAVLAAISGEEPTAPDLLPEMFGGLNRMIATSSKDWGEYAPDAWLWGLFCGWDCETHLDDPAHVHDDICGGTGGMEEMARTHGWSAQTMARLRSYRAAVRAATGEPFPDGRYVRPAPTA
jgi:hypothetical protein